MYHRGVDPRGISWITPPDFRAK